MPASPPAKPPLLVVITGLPATGKTTLARRLAQELRLPLISKDDIKESLFDSLGWSDRQWSMKLGRASIVLMYGLLEKLLAAGVSTITETAFHPELAQGEFLAIQQRAPFRPYVIECVADGEITWQRWQQRIASGERHAGHADDRDPQMAEAFFHRIAHRPLDLGGIIRLIDTNDFQKLDLDSLAAEISSLLEET